MPTCTHTTVCRCSCLFCFWHHRHKDPLTTPAAALRLPHVHMHVQQSPHSGKQIERLFIWNRELTSLTRNRSGLHKHNPPLTKDQLILSPYLSISLLFWPPWSLFAPPFAPLLNISLSCAVPQHSFLAQWVPCPRPGGCPCHHSHSSQCWDSPSPQGSYCFPVIAQGTRGQGLMSLTQDKEIPLGKISPCKPTETPGGALLWISWLDGK